VSRFCRFSCPFSSCVSPGRPYGRGGRPAVNLFTRGRRQVYRRHCRGGNALVQRDASERLWSSPSGDTEIDQIRALARPQRYPARHTIVSQATSRRPVPDHRRPLRASSCNATADEVVLSIMAGRFRSEVAAGGAPARRRCHIEPASGGESRPGIPCVATSDARPSPKPDEGSWRGASGLTGRNAGRRIARVESHLARSCCAGHRFGDTDRSGRPRHAQAVAAGAGQHVRRDRGSS